MTSSNADARHFLKWLNLNAQSTQEEDEVALTVAQCEQTQILNWLGFDKFVFSFNVEENIIIHPAYYWFKYKLFLYVTLIVCHLPVPFEDLWNGSEPRIKLYEQGWNWGE